MGFPHSKRFSNVCYLRLDDLSSHQLLIAILEKSVETQIKFLDGMNDFERAEFEEISPLRVFPAFREREINLYSMPVIMEFLEERYPHPPFLPVLPVLRARSRMMAYRIQREWYPVFEKANCFEKLPTAHAVQPVVQGLNRIAAVFEDNTSLGGEDFSLLDLAVLPVLWRLSLIKSVWLNMPISVKKYAEKVFPRPSFEGSIALLKRQTFLEKESSVIS